MLSPAQLEKHNKSITASKIGAIIGLESAYESAYSVFRQMSGDIAPEQQDNMRLAAGNCAEFALEHYCVQYLGYALMKDDKGREHPQYPFLWCLPDRIRIMPDDAGNLVPVSLIEFKNVDVAFKAEWVENGPPEHIKAQCYFQSMIYDLPNELVVQFGGNDIKQWAIPRAPITEKYLLDKALEFWGDLQSGKVPEPDGHTATSEALKLMFPNSCAELVEGNDAQLDMLKELAECDGVIKANEIVLEAYKNSFKEAIGDAEGLIFSDGSKCTWKRTKDGTKFAEDAFAEDYPDMYKEYLIPQPGHRRFLYKLKKK